jgi:hypothetical protein
LRAAESQRAERSRPWGSVASCVGEDGCGSAIDDPLHLSRPDHTVNLNEKGSTIADTTQLFEVTYIGDTQYAKLLKKNGK